MDRRGLLLVACALPMAGCKSAPVKTFPTLASAAQAIESLASGHAKEGAWNLSQMLQHVAQSIEYSIDSYPEKKSGMFRATVGAAAFTVFDLRGVMGHALDEPIPGAPALDRDAPLPAAIRRALAALRRFESYEGVLAPHFAYGALDKAQYTRAHLMHLANHWTEVTP
ncbi:MAG: DUF1569 domain-containing protein [Aquincola sp.]|nr:DUF1569 domain-containing protein [Aquincola sp.]MDH4287348.1 DUF1569 domain-containing protein [Aquincola sp.]